MVSTNLAHDIITIIILYVHPKKLPSFFIQNNLKFSTKFIYNTLTIPLQIDNLHKQIELFTNVTLTGINIRNLQHNNDLSNLKLNPHSIKHAIFSAANVVDLKFTTITNLNNFINLKTLSLDNCWPIESLTLHHCPNLRTLSISHTCISNLNELPQHLRSLNASYCPIQTLLLSHPTLKNINISYCTNLTTINIINCPQLRTIVAPNCFKLISAIIKCPKLNTLKLTNCFNLLTLTTMCPNMINLNINKCKKLKTTHLPPTPNPIPIPHIHPI